MEKIIWWLWRWWWKWWKWWWWWWEKRYRGVATELLKWFVAYLDLLSKHLHTGWWERHIFTKICLSCTLNYSMITIASSFASCPQFDPWYLPKQHRPQLLSLPHLDHDTHHWLVRDPAVFLETCLTLFLLENSFSLNALNAALFGPQRKIIMLVGGFHDVQKVNLFLLLEMV